MRACTLLQRYRSPTDRRLWQLALPMIFSNITIPLLGLVDTAVIGHLNSAVYLSAVAVGGMVLAFLTMMLNFLRMSTTGITAQAKGAQDNEIESRAALLQALGQPLLLSGLLSFLLLLLQQPLIQLGLSISGVSGLLREYAELYLQIRFWAIPATLANLVLLGWLLGMQKMKAPVLLLVCGNITNIVLDVTLVLYADWQVRGVAVASVCAEYMTLLMGLWLVWRTIRSTYHIPHNTTPTHCIASAYCAGSTHCTTENHNTLIG
ncbi:MAG: MATE family efflux transporter [Plesiomonas sp.]|uniref:MATE family efflux transporter n=1 Tax=Plesiomonas sp. TaxID=2486279 RepID=UPI003F3EE596